LIEELPAPVDQMAVADPFTGREQRKAPSDLTTPSGSPVGYGLTKVVVKAIEVVRGRLWHDRHETFEQQEQSANENDSKNVSAETFQQNPEPPDIPHDQATALTHLAEHFLETAESTAPQSSLSEKYQVLLHINANAAHIDHKISQGPCCYVKGDNFLAPEVAQRLACDAHVRAVLEDDNGKVLNIGRRSRTIPRNIAHALEIRDNGCQFPGCGQTRTDAHHVRHWMAGGETSLNNLVSLCRTHHSMLHKGDFSIRVQDQNFIFVNSINKTIARSIDPQFPPMEADDRLQALLTDQAHLGINAQTAETRWRGETMDLNLAINAMCAAEPD